MIGGTFYLIAPDGTEFQIPSGDCDLLECLQRPECEYDSTLVHVLKGGTAGCGRNFIEEDSLTVYDSGDRLVTWHSILRHTGIWPQSHYTSTIRSYKRKNGGWKPRRTQIAANLHGTVYNPEDQCKAAVQPSNLQAPKKRKKRSNRMKFWPKPVRFEAKQTSLRTTFYFTGITATDYLEW